MPRSSGNESHDWELKGGARSQTSSHLPTDLTVWQCGNCGLSATRRLTARPTKETSVVLREPEIDEPCGVDAR